MKKINGIGKEYYDDGKLKFEGEYLNGKRNGRCREYYDNGHLELEGQYLSGERNGKGKEYHYDGSLWFEGEYKNGKKRNGKFYENDWISEFELINGNGEIKEYNRYAI